MDIENEPAQHYSDKTKSQLYQSLKESETDLYIPQRLSTLRQIKNILEIKSPDAFAAQIEELQSNLAEKKPKLYNFKDVVFRMLVSNDLKSDLNSAVDYLYNTYFIII